MSLTQRVAARYLAEDRSTVLKEHEKAILYRFSDDLLNAAHLVYPADKRKKAVRSVRKLLKVAKKDRKAPRHLLVKVAKALEPLDRYVGERELHALLEKTLG